MAVIGKLSNPRALLIGQIDLRPAHTSEVYICRRDRQRDLYTEIDRGYATFDTILVGRVTYEEMFAYWPGAETEEGGSEINRRMARKMNSYKKYVFTTTAPDTPLEWKNTEAVTVGSDEDIEAFINDLKASPVLTSTSRVERVSPPRSPASG
jgi:dihydrofolate reductase